MSISRSPTIIEEDKSHIPEILSKMKDNLSSISSIQDWRDYKAQVLTKDGPLDVLFSSNSVLLKPLREYLASICFSLKYDTRFFRPSAKIWHTIPMTDQKIRSLWHFPKIMIYFYSFQRLPVHYDYSIRIFNSIITYPLGSFFFNVKNLLRHNGIYDLRFSTIGTLFLNDLNILIPSANPDPEIFTKKVKMNITNVEEYEPEGAMIIESKNKKSIEFPDSIVDPDTEMVNFLKNNKKEN
jgi:hypothetical protein